MFESHKKELEKLGYKVYSNKVTGPKGDVIASVNPYGTVESKDPAVLKALKTPIEPKKAAKKLSPTPEVKKSWVPKIKKKVSKG